MRLTVISLVVMLALCGCDSEHERMIKSMQKQINDTTRADWQRDGIPAYHLIDARNLCQQQYDLQGCDIVASQLNDISISLASCKEDLRSQLCKALVHDLGNKDFSSLPGAAAIPLPNSPWYWSLPTYALESQSGKFDYRTEVAGWWWQTWSAIILSCSALFASAISAWQWFSYIEKNRRIQNDIKARQQSERIKQKQLQQAREEQMRRENELQVKAANGAAIAEQQRITSENLAKQKSAEAAARLAAEQAESAELLSYVFVHSKTRQRKILAQNMGQREPLGILKHD